MSDVQWHRLIHHTLPARIMTAGKRLEYDEGWIRGYLLGIFIGTATACFCVLIAVMTFTPFHDHGKSAHDKPNLAGDVLGPCNDARITGRDTAVPAPQQVKSMPVPPPATPPKPVPLAGGCLMTSTGTKCPPPLELSVPLAVVSGGSRNVPPDFIVVPEDDVRWVYEMQWNGETLNGDGARDVPHTEDGKNR